MKECHISTRHCAHSSFKKMTSIVFEGNTRAKDHPREKLVRLRMTPEGVDLTTVPQAHCASAASLAHSALRSQACFGYTA